MNKILEKWEEKTLDEICNFSRGLTYSKKDEVETSNNIVLRANNIDLISNSLNFDELKYINSEIIIPEDKKVKANSIMICISSGSKSHLGKVAFIDKNYGYAFGGFMGLIIPNDNILPKFLYYMLISPSFKNLIFNLTDGANINNLKYSDLKDFKLNIPPLSEQQRIVKILDEAFENIEKSKQNALQNLNNAKELFESALNRTLKDIENMGEFKELSSITNVKDGTHDSPKYIKDGIPFITQKNIKENGFNFITDDTKYITIEDHNKFYQRSNVKKDDILISMIGANRGMACIIDVDEIFSIKNVGLIKESPNINKYYLLYYLKSDYAKQYITEKSKGGAQEFVGLTALRAFPILYVAVEEQQKIVAQLDELQEQTKKLEQIYEQKIKDLDELKQSILQKAFNGEL